MKTIKENIKNSITVNKSEFICYLKIISEKDEVTEIIDDIKKENKNANHYCYGYIIDNIEVCSDDGEPGGTAGLPILNILKKYELNHILAVVVRYFGGVKLGTGGLIRAYSKSVKEALLKTEIINLYYGKEVLISFDYHDSKDIDFILNKYLIINKKFNEKIIYTLNIDDKEINEIKNKLNSYDYTIKVIKNIYYTK